MNLVIVESPSKAKKIEKYLGKGWRVVASYGHIRDLPRKALGVDVKNDFAPSYEISKGKKKTVNMLTSAAKKADAIYLASDPDREGEAIAWHVQELLNPSCPVYRVTFNQITPDAIKEAFKTPRQLDMAMVNSQQTRRILDRLVGWKVSPILRLKFKTSLSAGRVQSVAVRLVVEREEQIENFTPEQSWSLSAHLTTSEKQELTAKLVTLLAEQDKELDPKRLPAQRAQAITTDLSESSWQVSNITAKEKKRRPPAPFITSTLQQKASSKLKMKPKQTMEVAQKLYEEGHITYMRTDSPFVATEAVQAAREVIQTHFPQALPNKPPTYKAKGDAQEAHECIRPTDPTRMPNEAASGQQAALYELIWTRFISSQMKPAIYHVVVATIQPTKDDQALPYQFAAQGKSLHESGWLVLEKKTKGDETLPALQTNQPLTLKKLDTKEQWTKAPSRYTEPKLISALEKAGVGRPSTYASIMETIQERGYVTDTGKSLAPTESGQVVTEFLVKQFPELLNLDFTKQMEDNLDRIAEGVVVWQTPLGEFHTKLTQHLNDTKQTLIEEGILTPCPKCEGAIATLTGKYGEYQRCLSCNYKPNSSVKTGESCPECKKPLVERTGKHGKFISCSGYPECKYRPLNTTGENCPDCGKPLVEKKTKKGTFVGCSGYPSCCYIKPTNTTGEKCPDCERPLVEKKSKKGTFVGCSGYPRCKYIKPTNTTGEKCPDCDKPLVKKKSKKGAFVGCSGYPKCKYIKPTNTTGKKCPNCDKPLVKRKGKYGSFIGCSGYPNCKYIDYS